MKGFSKYQEGQEISAYTSKDEIFEGYIKTKNNIKYVVNANGKAKKLSELKKVKRVGRIIEADMSASLKAVLDQYDMESVTKDNAGDAFSKELSDLLIHSDPNFEKAKPEELQGEIEKQMTAQSIQQQVDNGSVTPTDATEKYKKDADEIEKENGDKSMEDQVAETVQESLNIKGIAPEKLFNNRDIQNHILKEMELKLAAGAEYLQPETDYGMGPDHREDAIEDCMDMITSGEPAEKIIDYLQTEFEIAKDEAENMYADLSQDDLEWDDDFELSEDDEDEYDLYGVTYSDISNDVDEAFEKELYDVDMDELGFGDALVEHLANKFGGDATKAINESTSTEEAVLKLAEQVKMIRVNEIRSKNR